MTLRTQLSLLKALRRRLLEQSLDDPNNGNLNARIVDLNGAIKDIKRERIYRRNRKQLRRLIRTANSFNIEEP